MNTPKDTAVPDAMVSHANDLADDLLAALKAPTSHVSEHPYINDSDIRAVTLDGQFDLVAVCRHFRESLRREMIELLKQTNP